MEPFMRPIKRFDTESGSTYELDLTAKKWRRIKRTGHSGQIRTKEGTFCQYELVKGQSAVITCPPINPSSHHRLIITSPVTEIYNLVK